MKARVKATGDIVEVTRIMDKYINTNHPQTILFEKDELDFFEDEPDYWERLKHQYAGMAMQGLLSYQGSDYRYDIPQDAVDIATALVEKLKEESNGN